MRLIAFLLLGLALATRIYTPVSSQQALDQIQGNNFNVYVLFFYQSNSIDDDGLTTNNAINNQLSSLLQRAPYRDNETIIYMKIDASDKSFDELAQVVGITATPSVLLIVNGKGMWLSGANVPLLIERVEEFLPDYAQASQQKKVPRYAGFQ